MAVGDYHKEEFSKEELAALGRESEVPEEEDEKEEAEAKGPDNPEGKTEEKADEKLLEAEVKADETEHKEAVTPKSEEAQAAEQMGFRLETDDKGKGKAYVVDEDGTRIPPTRWKSLYWDFKNEQREKQATKDKFDLFKRLGADEYYRVYPDEAPEGWKPQGERQQATPQNVDPMKLQVQGGTYAGMTLEQVKEVDPFEAARMLSDWKDGQREAVRAEQERTRSIRVEQETEATRFSLNRAKELFGVDDPAKITPEQMQQVDVIGRNVLKWQEKNNCLHYSWEDAYRLMTYEDRIAKARAEGAKGTLKSITDKKGPASIDTAKGGDVKLTGFEAFENMTEDQLTDHIDNKMTESEYLKFLTDAPKSLRAKYPELHWR